MIMAEAQATFRLLGELEVEGVPRTLLGGPKQRALLAYLLLNANELVPRDRLVDAVWGEHAPPTARAIVHGYVRKLRGALGGTGARIEARSLGYVLEIDSEDLDLHRFERLAREGREALVAGEPKRAHALLADALALWRGEPLVDLAEEPSVETAARRLEGLRLEATMDRIDADLALRADAGVVGELEELVLEHPFTERLRAQLMLALYRAGRQADALDAYRAAKGTLVEELGIDPGPNLQQLEAAILRQDPVLAGPGPSGKQPARRRLNGAVAGAIFVLAAAAVTATLVVSRSHNPAALVKPNSVGIIDPRTNQLVGQIPVGTRPGAVAVGGSGVWIANLDDGTISRIDPRSRRVVGMVPLGDTFPSDIALGPGAVWVADGAQNTVVRVSPALDSVAKIIPIGCGATGVALPASVAVGGGAVWFVCGVTLARIDPATNRVRRADYPGLRPDGIAAAIDALWIANREENIVSRVNPRTMEITDRVTVASYPGAIALGSGAVWVAALRGDAVSRLAGVPITSVTVPVGDAPIGVTAGEGGIWVATSGAGTVSRIDPRTHNVVATVTVGNRPAGIAAGHGAVWVSVQAKGKGGLR